MPVYRPTPGGGMGESYSYIFDDDFFPPETPAPIMTREPVETLPPVGEPELSYDYMDEVDVTEEEDEPEPAGGEDCYSLMDEGMKVGIVDYIGGELFTGAQSRQFPNVVSCLLLGWCS